MKRHRVVRVLGALVLLAMTMLVPRTHAEPLSRDRVPEPLQPWVDWALHGARESLCPFLAGQQDSSRCAWPGRLELELDEHGGRFTQSWTVDVESTVPLPGGAGRWPEDVKLDGAAVTPLARAGVPTLRLAIGAHSVAGVFRWDALPEALEVAPDVGLVSLTLRNAAVAFPSRDTTGRVWLGRVVDAPAEEDRVTVRVSRRVVDEVPLQLTTRIELAVSGKAREVHLGPALPAGFAPLSLSSPLAARLEADGRLRVQVRPGDWTIELVARHDGPVESLALPAPTDAWAEGGEETWVWDARPALRVVEIEDVIAVDPQQTTLPDDWKSLPAYRMAPDVTMKLVERRRGNEPPEPDRLTLERELWLDFDGGGYTVRDHLTGALNTSFRLEMPAPTKLGRVALYGRDQVVTRRPGSDRDGIEVRQGQLALDAESRIDAALRTLPAVSWDTDVESLSATIHLPPGWRVFAARGADQVPGTWVEGWTLLDFFAVLIAALAFRRLWGWVWGGAALVGLALIHPEAHGFTWLFLAAVAFEAVLRLLAPGTARRWVRAIWIVLVGYAVLTAVPFLVWQVRVAMYPALEQPHYATPDAPPEGFPPDFLRYHAVSGAEAPVAPASPAPREAFHATESEIDQPVDRGRQNLERRLDDRFGSRKSRGLDLGSLVSESSDELQRFDPNAVVNTGPGIPSWSWNQVSIGFSGPVQREQDVSLYLLSPAINALLNVLRATFLGLLVLRLLGPRGDRWPKWLGGGARSAPAVAAAALVTMAILAAPNAARADVPNQAILDQLRARLTERPVCHPDCASIARAYFDVSGGRLKARLEVAALAATAIPLPGSGSSWTPSQVLVDGKATAAVRDESGTLWALLSAQSKEVLLDGPLPERDEVAIPLPLVPARVEVKAPGFTIEGVHENGEPDSSLTLRRERTEPADPDALDANSPQVLPSFLSVTRSLSLGLKWEVTTRVTRLSPSGAPATAQIPLLPGESVTTEGSRVEKGHVLVTLASDSDEAEWSSTLAQQGSLELVAPATADFVEIWQLGASTLWHVEATGLAPIHPGDVTGVRVPEWHPWPGEKLALAITRPEGVPGATLTIDSSLLAVTPGLRSTDSTLTLSIRSSRGGRHVVTLPAGAELTAVKVGDVPQPLRMDGSRVTLPIHPGSQVAEIAWREARGIATRFTTSRVDAGAPSVNATVRADVSTNRWVLFVHGPRLGPAVLFWSLLAVLLVVSIALGRVPLTPLGARHWFLLGMGLTQLPIGAAAIVAIWLLALGLRRERVAALDSPERRRTFNLVQVALATLTLVALATLFWGIERGLLGLPEMQIRGNGSSGSTLRWFADRAAGELPTAWIVSAPLWIYRVAMLVWALWIAASLIRWLKWAWESFTTGGGWKPAPPKPPKGPKGVPPRREPSVPPHAPPAAPAPSGAT
ncbi:MAG: hypothetical protein U0610_26815 [bacterium]